MKRRTQVAVSAVLALGGVYLLADAFDLTPGMLSMRPITAEAAPYPTVQQLDSSAVHIPQLDPDAPIPDAAAVQKAVDSFASDSRITGGASIEFVDTMTGAPLASLNPTQARTPASNTKVATAIVALEKLGPDSTLSTATKRQGSTVFLVGGGDTLLGSGSGDASAVQGRAGIGDLAAATAEKLKADGQTSVTVEVDSSLFAGSVYAEEVSGVDTGYIMEMRPIAIMQSRNEAGRYTANPDLQAGQVFAQALTDQGINATFEGRGQAPKDAEQLASVDSATVRELVDFTLTESDNTTADVLGHMVSLKMGGAATFDAAGEHTVAALKELGYDTTGVTLRDNSGLSISNKLTTKILVQAFDNVYTCDGCPLEAIGSGIPVMGLNGTLDNRAIGSPIAGKVRAKTGTLITANTLSGYLLTENGRLLSFSILVDGIETGKTTVVRPAMDELLTAVVGL